MMSLQTREWKWVLSGLFTGLSILAFAEPCCPQESVIRTVDATRKIHIEEGKSVVIRLSQDTKRLSIANPKVADFVLVSPREIYLTGKGSGITNMTLWQNQNDYTIYDVEVSYDISVLKEKLHEVLPEETGIRVTATNGSIVLSGKVTSSTNLSHALAIAQAHSPEGKVQNLAEVGGVQQVMLEVRVAEMQKSVAKRLGINFNFISPTGKFGISKLGGLTDLTLPANANISTGGPFSVFVSPVVEALFRFTWNDANWTFFIDALKENGLLKILAEPTLIAMSGQEAYFLAGGEFPVPIPQGLGTVAIEYKPFGVGLKFLPTVLGERKIHVKVAPEVSELDFTTAVQFSGFVVPGINTRRAETAIELDDGQSFAIAGLLRETVRDNAVKYPFLGDIPVLGALFKSHSYQKSETELVIIVTPRLVKPLDMERQGLPTDTYKSPSDFEFYVLGLSEGRPEGLQAGYGGGMDGEFGHQIPE